MKTITAIYLEDNDVLSGNNQVPTLTKEAEAAAQVADITIYKKTIIRNNIDHHIRVHPKPSIKTITNEFTAALIGAIQSEDTQASIIKLINDNITESQKGML